jgi:VWFA-related protein
MDMRRTAASSVLLALTVTLPGVAQTPVVESSRISVDVNLVVLHATVTDRKGHAVSGLPEQDFQIFEEGVAQHIKLFAHEDLPVAAGLIVDHSGSMKRKLAEVSAAARTFVQASNPSDQMFVVNFNEHVELGLPPSMRFSSDPAELEQAISKAPAIGKTALYDAAVRALELLKEGGPDKKVLVVVSDGGDNASKHTLDQTLKLAEQSSAIIYALGIFDQDDADRNPRVLRRLAEVTGGLAFFPYKLDEVSEICARIARDIRDQYTIGYSPARPARPGEYRAIRVVANAPHRGKLIVRTRTGYRFGGEARDQK